MVELAAAESSVPRILGRYAIYDVIAAGGMATVHYGRLLGPVGFARTVAIKRLHPQLAQDPEFVTMFLDEARIAARIRHPNVVATLDVVATSNEIFLVMDYVHGESLARILHQLIKLYGTVPLPIALRIATDVLQGLHAAHEATDERGVPLNIVHRDVSPHNVLLGIDGVARLVDFGVAKAMGRSQITREGQVKGKLSYMAPEQLRAEATLTRQVDVHALSAVLWEMLAGKRLFGGRSETEIVGLLVMHEIPSLSRTIPGIPPEVDAVLQRGLAVDLAERYRTAREMCLDLETCGAMTSTMQVGDWVQQLAKETIDLRSRRLVSIERDRDSGAQLPSLSESSDSSGSGKDWLAHLSKPDPSEAAKATAPLAPSPSTSATAASGPEAQRTVTATRPESPAPDASPDAALAHPPAPRALVWAAGIACAALLVGTLWAVRSRFVGRPPSTVATSTISSAISAAPPAVPTPVGTAVADESPSAVPTASAAAASAGASASAPAVAPAAPRSPGARPASKRNCDPPFTIDNQGVRIPKRECFR